MYTQRTTAARVTRTENNWQPGMMMCSGSSSAHYSAPTTRPRDAPPPWRARARALRSYSSSICTVQLYLQASMGWWWWWWKRMELGTRESGQDAREREVQTREAAEAETVETDQSTVCVWNEGCADRHSASSLGGRRERGYLGDAGLRFAFASGGAAFALSGDRTAGARASWRGRASSKPCACWERGINVRSSVCMAGWR